MSLRTVREVRGLPPQVTYEVSLGEVDPWDGTVCPDSVVASNRTRNPNRDITTGF
jgi:hypothetical protein